MRARILTNGEDLPIRATRAERISMLRTDVQTAADNVKRRLLAHFGSKYSITGWSVDEDGWEVDCIGNFVLVHMRITRPDDD